jgi:hypothetical protein
MLDAKKWKNRFYFLMRGIVKSCREACGMGDTMTIFGKCT